MKPFILGAVFARGGSKGIPRKNIKPLAGKPLISYSVEMGLSISDIDAMIVSTDDEKIAQIALQYGAEVPFMRPAALATDTAPELLSWQHAVDTYQKLFGKTVDVLVSIPSTAPFRVKEDVQAVIELLLRTDADIVVTGCPARRNPYFNMVTMDMDGTARLILKPEAVVATRQTAPVAYDLVTVAYACRGEYILHNPTLFGGKVKMVIVPAERSMDIDTILDWEIAEIKMKQIGD